MVSSFDLSELTKLSADLGDVPKNAGPLINSAIQGTSVRHQEGCTENGWAA